MEVKDVLSLSLCVCVQSHEDSEHNNGRPMTSGGRPRNHLGCGGVGVRK